MGIIYLLIIGIFIPAVQGNDFKHISETQVFIRDSSNHLLWFMQVNKKNVILFGYYTEINPFKA